MEMQKDSAFSAWLFLVKPHPRSILTERRERQDIPVPATIKKSAITKVMALFLFSSLSFCFSL
jgi:hypothetical protein